MREDQRAEIGVGAAIEAETQQGWKQRYQYRGMHERFKAAEESRWRLRCSRRRNPYGDGRNRCRGYRRDQPERALPTEVCAHPRAKGHARNNCTRNSNRHTAERRPLLLGRRELTGESVGCGNEQAAENAGKNPRDDEHGETRGNRTKRICQRESGERRHGDAIAAELHRQHRENRRRKRVSRRVGTDGHARSAEAHRQVAGQGRQYAGHDLRVGACRKCAEGEKPDSGIDAFPGAHSGSRGAISSAGPPMRRAAMSACAVATACN